MQQMPLSASMSAPASMQNSLLSLSCRYIRVHPVWLPPDAVRRKVQPVKKPGAGHSALPSAMAQQRVAAQLCGTAMQRACTPTLTTVAVRPAADELLPLVYTARGRKAVTYLRRKGIGEGGRAGLVKCRGDCTLVQRRAGRPA